MNIFLLLIVVICWTIQPFYKKIPLISMTYKEYYLLNHIIYTIPIIFYMLFDKNRFSFVKKMTKRNIFFIILSVAIGILGGVSYTYLLKQNNINYLIPHTNPLIIIFTLLIGYFIFKESMSLNQIIGILLVIIGLIIINYK